MKATSSHWLESITHSDGVLEFSEGKYSGDRPINH